MHPVAPLIAAYIPAIRACQQDAAHALQVVIHQAPEVHLQIPLRTQDQRPCHLLLDPKRDRPDFRLHEIVPFVPVELAHAQQERRHADRARHGLFVQLNRVLDCQVGKRQRPDLFHAECFARDHPRCAWHARLDIIIQQPRPALRTRELLCQAVHLHDDRRFPFALHKGVFGLLRLLQIVGDVLQHYRDPASLPQVHRIRIVGEVHQL